MSIGDKTFVGFLALSLLYLVWHLGRAYEVKNFQADLVKAYQSSWDTDFIIPNGDRYEGEWAGGRCFHVDGEVHLIKWYPMSN